MGLLSRFGRGLTQAAPIMGQMAQVSLLQAAEDKKYNRLVEREELAHTRLTGREATARGEARELLKIRGEQTSAAAQSTALQKYFSDSKTQLYTLLGVQEREMGDFNRQLENPMVQGDRADELNKLKAALAQRMADTQESIQKYDRLQRQYVDPEGKILPGAPLVTDDYLRAVSVGAANEVIDAYGIDSTGRTTLISSPLIRDQIDTLNSAIGTEFGIKNLTKEQEDTFTELVNDVIRDAEKGGERRGRIPPERPTPADEQVVTEPTVPGVEPEVEAVEPAGEHEKLLSLREELAAIEKQLPTLEKEYKAATKERAKEKAAYNHEALLRRLFESGISAEELTEAYNNNPELFKDANGNKISLSRAMRIWAINQQYSTLKVKIQRLKSESQEIKMQIQKWDSMQIEYDNLGASNQEASVEDAISMLFNPKSMV